MYNWDPARCQEEWDLALRDPLVRKSKDTFGHVTVAKLYIEKAHTGRQVSSTSRVMAARNHDISGAEDLAKLREGHH